MELGNVNMHKTFIIRLYFTIPITFHAIFTVLKKMIGGITYSSNVFYK